MQADLSSLFLQTLLIWFLSLQYYGSYGKKSAKNSTFLCKVAPIDGIYTVTPTPLTFLSFMILSRETKR
jgi:hypothetical protein